MSAAFQVLLAPLTYFAYRHLVVTHALSDGRPVSWWWWLGLLAYLVLPYALGSVTARTRSWNENRNWLTRVVRRVVGLYTAVSPEPRAWDALFSQPGITGWVRLRLNDGTWKAGIWSGAYASGYPEDGDMYMPSQVVLDEHGNFEIGEDRLPQLLPVGLLIRWSEVQFLEFIQDGAPADG